MPMVRTREIKFEADMNLLKQIQAKAASGVLGDGDLLGHNILSELSKSSSDHTLDSWITNDPAMLEVKAKARAIVRATVPGESNPPVLITGPTGVGKELLAKSLRIEGEPFVAVNCGGLPESLVPSLFFGHKRGSFTDAKEDSKGYLRQAGDGIIFLDEIGDLPLHLQATLLRAIQESEIYPVGSVDPVSISCRFVAATKYDLEALVSQGKFREDLFARIMTFHLAITPLKDRPDDIPLIAAALNHNTPFDETTIQQIYKYNVRAIQAAIQRWRTFGKYN